MLWRGLACVPIARDAEGCPCMEVGTGCPSGGAVAQPRCDPGTCGRSSGDG